MMNNINNIPQYTSLYDLGCSATLITLGYKLVSLDKSNPKKVHFFFERSPEIQEMIDQYWADELNVNPRTLIDNMKMLKNRIYSE